jgi:CheY-like chemotaxis protein
MIEQTSLNEFAGLRLLMAEDEMVLAMSLEDLLHLLDCQVVKAPSVRQALALVEKEPFDGALLDLKLSSERVYPVADALDQRGIPYIFMTGYGVDIIHADYRSRPAIQKPFTLEALEHAMTTEFVQGRETSTR